MNYKEQTSLELISKVLESVLKKKITLQMHHTAKDIPGWDSLNNVKILLQLEMATNTKIDTGSYFECRSVKDLVAYIDKLMGIKNNEL